MYFIKSCTFICLLIFAASFVNGQNTVRLQGKITDTSTGSPVEDVAIIIEPGNQQKTTNSQGGFTTHLYPGIYNGYTRHLAYKEVRFTLQIKNDTVIHILLSPIARQLDEATITGSQKDKSISGLSGGRIDLNMEELKSLPKFIGTNDPLKIIQLMPGIQTAGEGNSGIFVRGGEPGHNLVLWNDAPVYNASHLLGSFSVFNTGHIGSFKLHKSNIPADYGGRLSSLIEVRSPENIPDKVTVSGDIGLISSQITLALPFGQKSALYLSGRKTYVGLTLKPFIRAMVSNKGKEMPFDYEFQDYNLTFVNRPSTKDKITLNAYWGMDKLNIEDPEYMLAGDMKWWNLASSLSWEHRWAENTVMKNTFFLSQYQNKLDMLQNTLAASMPSHIRDIGFRNKFTIPLGRVDFNTGIDYIYHSISPQTPFVKVSDKDWGDPETQLYHTHETGVFLSARIQLLPQLTAEAGLRYVFNFQTGPYNDLTYNNRGEVVDSVHFGKGEITGFRHYPEPRINFRYTPDASNSIQFSYNRQKQFINLVSISGVGLPTDFWVPASKNIPPQSGDNFSLGYFRSLCDNDYEFSTEAYYRRMTNQMEFKSTLFDLFNQQYVLEKSILYGKGKTYGIEFMFKKNAGKLSGWISYTLGWSKRSFPEIMNGQEFSAKHDRRHDLSVVGTYKLNKKWDFSSVFVYATGNAFTMPQGVYMMGGNIVKEYGKYNGARMPAYHRLDVSANYWFFKRKGRESGINFSIYNIYKRGNPMYIFIVAKPSEHGTNQIIVKEKHKQLYDIIPSLSWTFKF